MAATTCSLADCKFCLSPPDIIHFIPPQIKYISAIIIAIINIVVIRAEINLPPRVKEQRLRKVPVGHVLIIACAKAEGASVKNVIAGVIVAINFFMSY